MEGLIKKRSERIIEKAKSLLESKNREVINSDGVEIPIEIQTQVNHESLIGDADLYQNIVNLESINRRNDLLIILLGSADGLESIRRFFEQIIKYILEKESEFDSKSLLVESELKNGKSEIDNISRINRGFIVALKRAQETGEITSRYTIELMAEYLCTILYGLVQLAGTSCYLYRPERVIELSLNSFFESICMA
jgi:hypothetical protein